MKPYWRYAVELYPYQKKRIAIARFACRQKGRTFSLLPDQLIPYCQYTVDTVVRTILTVLEFRRRGQRGFYGACLEVDPESSVTPWLIACWLGMMLKGLRCAHPTLRTLYDLTGVRSAGGRIAVEMELNSYLIAFGLSPPDGRVVALRGVVRRFSRRTGRFLFGTPSQLRRPQSA